MIVVTCLDGRWRMERTRFVYINSYGRQSGDANNSAVVVLTAFCTTVKNIRPSCYSKRNGYWISSFDGNPLLEITSSTVTLNGSWSEIISWNLADYWSRPLKCLQWKLAFTVRPYSVSSRMHSVSFWELLELPSRAFSLEHSKGAWSMQRCCILF